jgi:hypothetical protein
MARNILDQLATFTAAREPKIVAKSLFARRGGVRTLKKLAAARIAESDLDP